jgi:hypothetical protein
MSNDHLPKHSILLAEADNNPAVNSMAEFEAKLLYARRFARFAYQLGVRLSMW